ncbi:hypothetical protein [Rhizobium lentis]|uniref:hypothetical protein n=1 Tax=Rhizobium lentis TaxID=1138194 RepID=UPI001C836D7B|nr:hypothetical protein [Rhizobium lentis]
MEGEHVGEAAEFRGAKLEFIRQAGEEFEKLRRKSSPLPFIGIADQIGDAEVEYIVLMPGVAELKQVRQPVAHPDGPSSVRNSPEDVEHPVTVREDLAHTLVCINIKCMT